MSRIFREPVFCDEVFFIFLKLKELVMNMDGDFEDEEEFEDDNHKKTCRYGGGTGCQYCAGIYMDRCPVAGAVKEAAYRRVANALVVHSYMRADS